MLQRGFTLVEILVALVIVSVGMLALGSFYTSMISQEGIAQERITAVHMAEQLIEDWQANNTIPTPSCKVAGVVPTLVLATPTSNCVPTKGTPIAYTILLNESAATAPLPVTHPSNTSTPILNGGVVIADTTGMYPMLTLSDVNKNVIANSPKVMVRLVKVSWTHGIKRSVYLTHITRYIP